MNTFTVALVLVCCLLHQYVEAQDDTCGEEMMVWKKKVNEIIEEDKLECTTTFDFKRFVCTGGVDKEEDKKKQEEMLEWYKGLDGENKEKAMECMKEVNEMSFEETGISDDCKGKINEAVAAMAKAMNSDGESE